MKILFLLFSMIPALHGITQPGGSTILVKNVTIISANETGVLSIKGNVVIRNDTILYAGKKKPKLAGHYKVINGRHKYIMPGLIDTHVHLASIAGMNGALRRKYPELVHLYFQQLPKSFLYYGFTTLVDLNNYAPTIIDQLRQENIRPDIFTCGEQVMVMNDFMMEMDEYSSAERYNSRFLHDSYNPNVPLPDSILPEDHHPARIATQIREQAGICAKIVYEDEASGLPVSWEKPSTFILKDLISVLQSFNMPLILHAPSLEGHQVGLESGINIFAHGLWNWYTDPGNYDQKKLTEKLKQVLHQIAQRKTGYQLTFRTITGEKDMLDTAFLYDPQLKNCFPEAFLEFLKTEEGQWGKRKILQRGEFLSNVNPALYTTLRRKYDSDTAMWAALHQLYKYRLDTVAKILSAHNANFMIGSDSPSMNMYTNPPGYNGFLEMKHWHDAGISLSQIFRAATLSNAKAIGLQHLYGSVSAGKLANLLILRSNPLQSIHAYDSIETVIIRGKMIPRASLSASYLQ